MANPALRRLVVPRAILEQMHDHARAEQPLECCGLLAGRIEPTGNGQIERSYRLINEARSPTEYISEPRSMFEACRDLRRAGLDVLAVYHSHPRTRPIPSSTDLQRCSWGYPAAINLIISLLEEPPQVAAWWLTETTYEPAEWLVEDSSLG